MATVQIRRPKNVWGNNLTLNYDISVSVNNILSLYLFLNLLKSCNLWVFLHYSSKFQDVNTPQECPVPAKYLPDVECVERIQPIALQQHV